jgi:hypothetical protein
MHMVYKYRVPALSCALAVLLCDLIAQPYVTMGVCDDGPYILMARTLANTGHIVFNGWAAPMLGWQLYLGAAFIKLFGFSFTAVRMSTMLVAMLTAFLLQRSLVLIGIKERNATLGTLAFVLSPLYLVLSATYMTDIFGLFAIVICLYGCLRALLASTANSTIGWLCFAIVTNAICGTSRQVAWLGVLILVPSTLWLLRARRRVLLAGASMNLLGVLFVFVCVEWLKRQPYSIPEHVLPPSFPVVHILGQLSVFMLEIPFLLLPIFAIFIPEIRRNRPRILAILAATFSIYFFLAAYPSHLRGGFLLEPTMFWQDLWVGVHGIFEGLSIRGRPPGFMSRSVQVLLTIVSFGGLTGLVSSVFLVRSKTPEPAPAKPLHWRQLAVLFAPFTFAYLLLLVPRASGLIFDRYLLPVLVVTLLCLVRYHQDRISPRLPLITLAFIAMVAAWGITLTHNTFALYRGHVALIDELRANGIPDTSVDNGWEYDLTAELQHAPTINDPTIVVPAHAYVAVPPLSGHCSMLWYDRTPHIHPLYSVSFDPDACYGLAPFAPVHYSRWLAPTGTLYVVHFLPPPKP